MGATLLVCLQNLRTPLYFTGQISQYDVVMPTPWASDDEVGLAERRKRAVLQARTVNSSVARRKSPLKLFTQPI